MSDKPQDEIRKRAEEILCEHCEFSDKFDCHIDAMIAFAAQERQAERARVTSVAHKLADDMVTKAETKARQAENEACAYLCENVSELVQDSTFSGLAKAIRGRIPAAQSADVVPPVVSVPSNGWLPIETAPLGKMVRLFHRAWRHEWCGQVIDVETGKCALDTPTPEHRVVIPHFAELWQPIIAPTMLAAASRKE